jgi:hypothetical protein
VIGLAPHHHAIDMAQVSAIGIGFYPAIDQDFQFRSFLFQPVDVVVFQRRDFAVFLGAEALEDGIARMYDKGTCASGT